MATLYFKIGADYENVIRLRDEIKKLENQLKSFGKSTPETQIRQTEERLATTRQEFVRLTTEAAKAGAEIENGFKKKIYDASQTVNGLSEKIIAQRAVIKDIEFDVKRLGDAYRTALKRNPIGASGKLDEYNAARKALDEEKAVLFGLTQQQAEARLSVKKLRDEYSLYKKEAGDTVEINNGLSVSWQKMLGVIGGVTALKSLASQIVRVRGEFQSMQTAIETMVGKDVVSGLMAQLKEMAKISPLTLSDMVNAEKMMLGFNIQAEDTVRYLQALSDISMGDSVKFKSLTLAFSQMSAAGKLMGQDLNQMINAGFNPLQIISEKTGKSMATLKDEMSKGAVSAEMVQQAFIDATSAGGKFYQMSKNASKTINGQLSMMQDALDAAFNEMGQASEEVIMDGIQFTTSLIQNYETVGKVLVGLVATYGTYRTAVMLATVATSKHTIAEVALTNARVLTRKAQMLLNASMLTNPYVAVATVVAALVATMWTLSDSTSAASKATREYNQAKEEAAKRDEEHKRKIDELINAARDESLATLTRQKSLETLRNEYPKIFEQYDIEKLKLEDILSIKKQINEEDSRKSSQETRDTYYSLRESVSNRNRYLQLFDNPELRKNMSNEDMNIWRMYAGKQSYVEVREEMEKEAELLKRYQQDVFSDNTNFFLGNIKNMTDEDISSTLDEITLSMKALGNAQKDAIALVESIGGEVSRGQLETIKSALEAELKSRAERTTYAEDYEQARKDWEEAKKALQKIEADKDKFTSKQYEDAKKRVETTEKTYKNLGGDTKGKTVKSENSILTQQTRISELEEKQAQERIRRQADLENQVEQAEIDALQDSAEKTERQRNLNNKKELQAIEQQKQDYIQSVIQAEKEIFDAKEKLKASRDKSYKIKTFDSSSVSVDTSLFDAIYANTQKRQANDKLSEIKQSMNEYLAAYGAYIDKRNAIIALGEEKKKGKNEWEQKSIDKETNSQLSKLDEEVNRTTSAISQLFGDMKEKTLADLQEINERGKEALEFLKGGQWDASKGAELGITEANFKEWSQDPEKIEAATNAIKQNQEAIDELRPAYDKVTDGVKKFFAAGSDPKKVTEALQGIQDGLNGIMQITGFLSDMFSSLGDSFGSDALSRISDGLNTAMDAVNSAMQGAQAGSMFGPIGAAAGAAIGLVGSLASSIAKIHDKKNEKQIQKLQDQIDALDKSYEKLGKSVEEAYSKDASKMIEQQNTLLEQQKVLIQNQIKEEQDKKKSDNNRIKEWQQQIEEINDVIEENKEKAVDAIFGEDVQSAIDRFSSAVTDMWADNVNSSQNARDAVKQMMQQMVTESIKSAIKTSSSMDQIRQKLQEFYADNVLSGWEQDYIYNMADELQKEIDRQFGWAEGLFKDDVQEQQSASSRGFGTEMTHEDAGELSGRFAAVHESNLRIETATQQQTVAITELKGSISGLISQTQSLYNIADETRTILANSYLELQEIRENTGEIVKPIKQMQEDIAEVKRNTSRI